MKTIQEGEPLFSVVEQLNGIRQFDFLKMTVQVALQDPEFRVSSELVCQLNNYAVAYLSDHPGRYRQCPIGIRHTPHAPPHHREVLGHMDEYLKYLAVNWTTKTPIHLAAYALWRMCWIHPFVEGNGRTARALCYLVLCVKLGLWLPGRKTITEQIRENRRPYYDALRDADKGSDDRIGRVHVAMMEEYLAELLKKQLQS